MEGELGRLQGGIYWDKGAVPPRCYAIAFLKADRDAAAGELGTVLARLAALWDGLKAETLPDLPGIVVPRSNFEWLLGYGVKAFAINGRGRPLPTNLRPPRVFNSVDPAGGGTVVDGSGLRYAKGLALNPATEEVAVQFTGDTPLSVNRAVVETWKLLEASRDLSTGRAPLMLSAAFTGFNREDARSWLNFHDGVSNLVSGEERKAVITIKRTGLPAADRWTVDGTYMAFIRLAVDLLQWERLDREQQELLVGRTKLSGCPLRAPHVVGEPQVVPGCPAAGSSEVTTTGVGNEAFREPPDGVEGAIAQSHVQRANQHQPALRLFRQGYEFLEPPIPGRPLSAGLNFVSFQGDPERLLFILRTRTWLGDTNFGGSPGPELLSVLAAAIFLCPPREEGEAFPGASIFPSTVADASATGAMRSPRRKTRSARRGSQRHT